MPAPIAHLGWNPNTEGNIDHYLLSVGIASGDYADVVPGSPMNVGNVTEAFFTLPGYGTFYFVLQAVNTANQPSGFSSEVSGNFQPVAPGPLPLGLRPHRFSWALVE
jgi:hypothetical protein